MLTESQEIVPATLNLALLAVPLPSRRKSLPAELNSDSEEPPQLIPQTHLPHPSVQRFKKLKKDLKQNLVVNLPSKKLQFYSAISMQVKDRARKINGASQIIKRARTKQQSNENFLQLIREDSFPLEALKRRVPSQQSEPAILQLFFREICELFKLNAGSQPLLTKFNNCMVFQVGQIRIIANKQGRVYVGYVVNELKEGRGVEWCEGQYFVGHWAAGRREGYGVEVDLDAGTRYRGEWKGGYRNGQGTLTDLESVYKGGFYLGQKHGQGETLFFDGRMESGFYNNGTLQQNNVVKSKQTKSTEPTREQTLPDEAMLRAANTRTQIVNRPKPVKKSASRASGSILMDQKMRSSTSVGWEQSQQQTKFQFPKIFNSHFDRESHDLPLKPAIGAKAYKLSSKIDSIPQIDGQEVSLQNLRPGVEEPARQAQVRRKASRLNWEHFVILPAYNQPRSKRNNSNQRR